MKTFIIRAALLLAPGLLAAGDYTLLVARPERQVEGRSGVTVVTPQELERDLRLILRGQSPEVPIVKAALSNAHVEFGGKEERFSFEAALSASVLDDSSENPRFLSDLLFMFASCSLSKSLGAVKPSEPLVQDRLRSALARVAEGLSAKRRVCL